MQIWVDADACPGEIKELLFLAAVRTQTEDTLVANRSLFNRPGPNRREQLNDEQLELAQSIHAALDPLIIRP